MDLDIPVIGILRGVDAAFFGDIMRVSFEAGLQAIEVTMNTEGAERIVAANRAAVPAGKLLGMGTIRNLAEAERAVAAGAMFMVSPNFEPTVIEYARSKAVPIIAGALTPTEVYAAWSAGADMVKVFPCRTLGPSYIHELRGPFDHIPLVAVGGVNLTNLAEYFRAGAAAVGAGASLFGPQALQGKNIIQLFDNVKKFIESCLFLKDQV